jgi:hypothetical protein
MGSAGSTTKPGERYPEDLVDNFLLAADLAPRLCPGCASYHVPYGARRAARRTSGRGDSDALDRPHMITLLADLIGERARADGSPIEVMLAGSADTGLLSISANAAAAAGPGVVERVRFSVLDRCPTPLVLCAGFGRKHGLNVAIQTIDLLGSDRPSPADIIVLHSVFRFVPRERHVEFLNGLMSWLKPGGRLVFSMGVKGSEEQPAARLEEFKEVFRREVQSGRIPFAHTEDFLATLSPPTPRAGNVTDVEAIRTLFRDADVRVERLDELSADPERRIDRSNLRVLAVLSRSD